MAEVTIGELLNGDEQRDAIHVAIAPVIANEKLYPGQRVGLLPTTDYYISASVPHVGIVDPFLQSPVYPEEKCWLFLFPNTVTGMRHHWSHPAFGDERNTTPTKEESEAWLRNFLKTADCPDYDTLIAAATGGDITLINPDVYGHEGYRRDNNYLHFAGRDAHGMIPTEFWDHVENVTGKKCEIRPSEFSCSC